MTVPVFDSEFAFELRTCRWAERSWPPDSDRDVATVVARQLGTKRRRWDTIVIECDPAALRERARFGSKRLDSDLLHVVQHAPDSWGYYRDVLPDPGYAWRYVREAIHQADDRGIVETRRAGNRIEIRRKWPYPDWIDRIVAIENKPDLDASAARRLGEQLEYDVAMALADEVWVATERGAPSAAVSDASAADPALFEDLPVEAGILSLDPDSLSATVTWFPRTLAVGEPGTQITERPDGSEYDASAARFEYVAPDAKAATRLGIAERAYERGWRSFVDTMRPDCRHFDLRDRDGAVPQCRANDCVPTAAQCSGSCPSFEPEPPGWRSQGWPIEGGPGASVKRLLAARRRRRRPEL
ncbi:DUF5787 family protein [Halobacteria archaeon AArc-dxtr1]|nr:DUF5787 family protein [Halobacteria archaeon AArc-dxtr1]